MNVLALGLLGNRGFDWAERRTGDFRSCPIATAGLGRAANVRCCHTFRTIDSARFERYKPESRITYDLAFDIYSKSSTVSGRILGRDIPLQALSVLLWPHSCNALNRKRTDFRMAPRSTAAELDLVCGMPPAKLSPTFAGLRGQGAGGEGRRPVK